MRKDLIMKKFNYFILSFLLCHVMVQSIDIDPEDFNEFVEDSSDKGDASQKNVSAVDTQEIKKAVETTEFSGVQSAESLQGIEEAGSGSHLPISAAQKSQPEVLPTDIFDENDDVSRSIDNAPQGNVSSVDAPKIQKDVEGIDTSVVEGLQGSKDLSTSQESDVQVDTAPAGTNDEELHPLEHSFVQNDGSLKSTDLAIDVAGLTSLQDQTVGVSQESDVPVVDQPARVESLEVANEDGVVDRSEVGQSVVGGQGEVLSGAGDVVDTRQGNVSSVDAPEIQKDVEGIDTLVVEGFQGSKDLSTSQESDVQVDTAPAGTNDEELHPLEHSFVQNDGSLKGTDLAIDVAGLTSLQDQTVGVSQESDVPVVDQPARFESLEVANEGGVVDRSEVGQSVVGGQGEVLSGAGDVVDTPQGNVSSVDTQDIEKGSQTTEVSGVQGSQEGEQSANQAPVDGADKQQDGKVKDASTDRSDDGEQEEENDSWFTIFSKFLSLNGGSSKKDKNLKKDDAKSEKIVVIPVDTQVQTGTDLAAVELENKIAIATTDLPADESPIIESLEVINKEVAVDRAEVGQSVVGGQGEVLSGAGDVVDTPQGNVSSVDTQDIEKGLQTTEVSGVQGSKKAEQSANQVPVDGADKQQDGKVKNASTDRSADGEQEPKESSWLTSIKNGVQALGDFAKETYKSWNPDVKKSSDDANNEHQELALNDGPVVTETRLVVGNDEGKIPQEVGKELPAVVVTDEKLDAAVLGIDANAQPGGANSGTQEKPVQSADLLTDGMQSAQDSKDTTPGRPESTSDNDSDGDNAKLLALQVVAQQRIEEQRALMTPEQLVALRNVNGRVLNDEEVNGALLKLWEQRHPEKQSISHWISNKIVLGSSIASAAIAAIWYYFYDHDTDHHDDSDDLSGDDHEGHDHNEKAE
jgi:hypothetical protein